MVERERTMVSTNRYPHQAPVFGLYFKQCLTKKYYLSKRCSYPFLIYRFYWFAHRPIVQLRTVTLIRSHCQLFSGIDRLTPSQPVFLQKTPRWPVGYYRRPIPPQSLQRTYSYKIFFFFYLSEPLHSFPAAPLFYRHPNVQNTILTKSCGQRSFSYQAPVIWNQLPVSVRHSTSVSSFKSSLKTFLFLKTFSSVSLP